MKDRPFSNPREQIVSVLETLGYEVSGQYPSGDVTLPRITYAQITNAYYQSTVDKLNYQVDVWASSFEETVEIATGIDNVMSSLKGRRTYESPDSQAQENVGLFHKALSYEFTVDLLLERFM